MSAIERTARYAAGAADHAARHQAFWSENAEKFRAQIAAELPTWVQSIYDSTHIPPTTDQKQKMIASATTYAGSSAREHHARHALYFDTTRKPMRSTRAASKRANDNIIVLGAFNLI
jgi:hypothetical protein